MSRTRRPWSVVLVDDHEVVRRGLKAFLSTQPDLYVVAEAGSGEDGVRLIQEHQPDVAVVDLVMDGMTGIDVTRAVTRTASATQIIILTSFDDDASIFPALRAGATSYVLKDLGADALADAVRKTAEGEAVLHPRVARRVVTEIGGRRDGVGRLVNELTDRELEVLGLIAQGEPNAAIAAGLVLSEKTVKGHVGSILAKLGLRDRTQAAAFAWRNNLAPRVGGPKS